MTSRPRFCGVCGVRVSSTSRTLAWPIAYCPEHAAMVRKQEPAEQERLGAAPTSVWDTPDPGGKVE